MPTKYRVEITSTAQRDTEEIWTYIAHDSPVKASSFILEFVKQISTLEQFPLRCPLIPENEVLGTSCRHLLYGDYRTLFEVVDKTVFILRIVHGSRLLDASYFEE